MIGLSPSRKGVTRAHRRSLHVGGDALPRALTLTRAGGEGSHRDALKAMARVNASVVRQLQGRRLL